MLKVLLTAALFHVALGDKLLFVNTFWRHGERTPLGSFPTDPYINYTWHDGFGELTAMGMKNQFLLGKRLRHRYVRQHKLLDKTFNFKEIFVMSTDVNRTIMSAISNLNGMFTGSGEKGFDYPNINGWPKGYVPIPIHVLYNLDNYGMPRVCPRRSQLLPLIVQTPEFNNFLLRNKELLDNLTTLTGLNMTDMNNVLRVSDTMLQQRIYGLPLAAWENQYYDALRKVYVEYYSFTMGYYVGIFRGINLALETRIARAGNYLWELINRMQYKAACMQGSTNLDCSWLTNLKYYALSGHDTTIEGLLSTMGATKLDFDIDQDPPQNSCLAFELWSGSNNSTYIKVIYLRPNQPEVDLTNRIPGCENGCTLEAFAQRSAVYQPLPSLQQWCNTLLVPTEQI